MEERDGRSGDGERGYSSTAVEERGSTAGKEIEGSIHAGGKRGSLSTTEREGIFGDGGERNEHNNSGGERRDERRHHRERIRGGGERD